MPHLPFVVAAYAVTLGGLALMLGWCIAAMRRTEAAAGAPRP